MPAYRLTEQSEYELDEIWIYLYLNASETIANRQVSLLKDRFRLLAHHPEMGRSREDYGPGIRRHNISGTPYYVLYTSETEGIEIIRVSHASRNISGAF